VLDELAQTSLPRGFDIEIKKIELEKRKGRREAGPLYLCERRAEARARFRIELAPALKEGRRYRKITSSSSSSSP
jgi:hypothetical protein